jgi:hypothetical protein
MMGGKKSLKMVTRREQQFAEDLLSSERNQYDGSPFWFGPLSAKRETAEKRVKRYNKLLKGTGIRASVYKAIPFRNVDWGISISGLTVTAGKKLAKKYNLKFSDYY